MGADKRCVMGIEALEPAPLTVTEAVRAAEQAVARLRQLGLQGGSSSSASSTTAGSTGARRLRSDGSAHSSGAAPVASAPSLPSRREGTDVGPRVQPEGCPPHGAQWASGSSGSSCVGSLAEGGPRGAPSAVFRRPLCRDEMVAVRSLLDLPSRRDLRDLAARQFEWAKQVSGQLPGHPGCIDMASATTAIRQLAYLRGLPAVDSRAARWYFDLHATQQRGCKRDGEISDIDCDEFEAAVEDILQSALLSGH